MSKILSDSEFKMQLERARARGKERARTELRAKRAFFDQGSNSITIELLSGIKIVLPCDSLVELRDADPSLIAQVELSPTGNALHWRGLDIDFSIGAVIADIFGANVLAEHGRIGGSVSSEPKRLAARENGKKGGRPPKAFNGTSRRARRP